MLADLGEHLLGLDAGGRRLLWRALTIDVLGPMMNDDADVPRVTSANLIRGSIGAPRPTTRSNIYSTAGNGLQAWHSGRRNSLPRHRRRQPPAAILHQPLHFARDQGTGHSSELTC